MASSYPGGADTFDTIAADKKQSDTVGGRTHRVMHNDLGDAIEAVQTELGTNPSGSAATVSARLTAIEAGTNLGTNSVGAAQIAPNAVGSSELADNAVDAAAIQAEAVTSAKLAKGLSLQPVTLDTVLSADLAPAIGSWTASGGASWSSPTWTLPAGGSIECPVPVSNGQIVQVDVTQGGSAALTVTVGSVTQTFAGGQNAVTVIASGSGTQTVTVAMAAGGTITAVTVRTVTTLPSPVTVGSGQLRMRSTSIGIGTDSQRSLTTGQSNTSTGYASQYSLTTGSDNTSTGRSSQFLLTTGNYNTSTGSYSQYSLTTGNYNTSSGRLSQYALTTGNDNTSTGRSSQYSLTTGNDNTSTGAYSQRSLTTGQSNTSTGANSQYSLTTGNYNTSLGRNAGYNLTTQSGTVTIGTDSGGTGAQAAADNEFVLGTGNHKVLIPGTFEMTGSDRGIILRSPNGTRYKVSVSNAGAVTVGAA